MRTCLSAVVLALAALSGPACGAPRSVLAVEDWGQRPRGGEFEGQVYRLRTAQFRLGPVTYGIKYQAAVKPDDPSFLDPVEGPVGMPYPVSENWYHSGFLFIELNGRRLDTAPLSSFEAAESGPRGVVDLVWHHPLAELRYRFLGLAEDDKLLLRVDLEPKVEVTSLRLILRAYPSFFTGWHKRAGARRMLTPGGVVEEGRHQTLSAEQGWWTVQYDEVFDVARGEGRGPCAMAAAPDGITSMRYAPDSYPTTITIDYEPTCRSLLLAFWDFSGQTNAEAIARFPAAAEEAVATLRTLDWTPALLRSFDPSALRAELARAGAKEAVRQQLGARLDEVTAWLDTCAPLFAGQEQAIAACEAFIAGWAKYGTFIWEIRLAELLDF